MNNKDRFPDYEPKLSPDTVFDYLRDPNSKVFKILSEIDPPSLKNLNKTLDYFKKYKIEANKNPGSFQQGNVVLGADMDQYIPSEEEILVSELGKRIRKVIESSSNRELDNFKEEQEISSQIFIFHEVHFRHVDAMGSGRFFYAEIKEYETRLKL